MAYIVDAILALDAKARVKVVSEDYDKITWFDNNPNKITVDQIKTKKAELDKINYKNLKKLTMNKYFLIYSEKLLKRLNDEANIKSIEKLK